MISQQTIETVKKRLVDVYHPLAIYLFGSYAWGEPTEESDLDILVIVDKSDEKSYVRPREGHAALRGLGISKDIIVFTKEDFEDRITDRSTLSYKILHEGVKLYEAV